MRSPGGVWSWLTGRLRSLWMRARMVAGRLFGPVRRLFEQIRRWLAPVGRLWARVRALVVGLGRLVGKVVRWAAQVLRYPLEWAWRGLLVVAATAMLAGGVLAAIGERPTAANTGLTLSDTVVTAGFGIGILAVPCWILVQLLDRVSGHGRDRPQAIDVPTLGKKRTGHEDQRGGADEELATDHSGMSGEPSQPAGG